MERTHPLREWRTKHGLTQGALADRLDVEASHISMIEREIKRPSMTLAARIQEITGGEITPNDFLYDAERSRSREAVA